MSTPPAPTRVFGYVAAEADVAVLLRRGPSKWVLMIRWDLVTDDFEAGQWLKARVYEAQCDLSPDGRLFAYRANDGQYQKEIGGVYDVISRPPYFTALALWQSDAYLPALRWLDRPLRFGVVGEPTKGSLPGSLNDRLAAHDFRQWVLSRGWNTVGGLRASDLWRPCAAGRLEWCPGSYQRKPVYILNGEMLDADWADVDHRGRLLLAREGRIYVRDADGERELIDLDPFEFRPLAPPNWAVEWPDEA